MKRIVILVLLGVLAFVVLLAVFTPASVVVSKAQLPPGLQVQDAQGTLWNGSARATWQTPMGPVTLDHIEWHYVPSQLFNGRVAYDLQASAPQLQVRGRMTHGAQGVEGFDLSVKGDASALVSLFPWAARYQPQGDVTITAPYLTWNEQEIRGDASIDWKNARAALPDLRTLGTYHAELHGTGGPANVTVTTVSGEYPIRAQGTATPQAVQLSGTAGGQDFAFRVP